MTIIWGCGAGAQWLTNNLRYACALEKGTCMGEGYINVHERNVNIFVVSAYRRFLNAV